MGAVIDFTARLEERDFEAKFEVDLLLHPKTDKKRQVSELIELVHGTVKPETVHISHDRLKFDRQAMNFFRNALMEYLTRVRRHDGANIGQIDPAVLKSSKTSAFLLAEFGSALEKGHSDVTLVPHVESAKFPIPTAFHILLPDPDHKSPTREDVLRAFTPFEKTLREIWRRESDEIAAVSILHKPSQPSVGFIRNLH